jgi:cyclophilin family peptidyl-prolyl cis-trans isomerase
MYAISDPSPLVRAEAVLAPHRWPTTTEAAAVVDSAICNVASKAPAELRTERWGLPKSGELIPKAEDSEVIWRALFTLERRKSERARAVFQLWARYRNSVEARIFANRGIASLSSKSPECMEALRESLADEDPRVAVEAAVGLGRFPEAASLPALAIACEHNSTQVRIAAVTAIAEFRGHRETARDLLKKRLVDESAAVRAEALVSMSKLFSDAFAADLELRSLDANPTLRRATARAAAHLTPPAALGLLTRLSADPVRSVSFAAASGLGPFLEQGGRERALALLASEDNGLRLGAILSLQAGPVAADLAPLLRAYTGAQGDLAGELEYEILKAAAKVHDDRAFELLVTGLRSRRPYTRQLARQLLAENFPNQIRPDDGSMPPRRGNVPSIDVLGDNPLVEVRTGRGTMVFELFLSEAPMHVYNFMTLARQGAYDGLDFHRVVPDFVIQGGDYRGDGNGGRSWRTEPLRAELSPRKFLTGSLGMPRNEDLDSGGSQFFVTHRPTPHLDGRYTLFGQLRQGEDVLQRTELGDQILSVTVRGAGAATR